MPVLLLILLLATAVSAASVEEQIQSRDFEGALRALAAQLPKASASERPRLLILKAECEVELKRPEAAEQTLAGVPVQGAPARFFRIRGQLNRALQHADLAGKDFRHVLTLPAEPREKMRAACALAELEDRPEAAQAWWARAVEEGQRPGVTSMDWLSVYRCRLGLLTKAGRLEEALSEARLARTYFEAAHNPGAVTGMLVAEAMILKDLGRFPEAEAAWTRALEMKTTKASGGILTMWGFMVLYGRTDPPALRRFLQACERYWSEAWAPYERYYLRMLQGQVYLFELDEPRKALHYFQLAEQLASPTWRPAGNFLTVNLRFHRLSSAPHSELEQVLFLQMRARRKLGGDLTAWMESKLASLPASERSPWLFSLGKEQLRTDPERAAAWFAQALEGSRGSDRSRLLEAMLEAYLYAGRTPDVRRTAVAFGQSLAEVAAPEALEISRELLDVGELWSQAVWEGSVAPGEESARTSILNAVLDVGGLRERFEGQLRQELETHQRARNGVALFRDYHTLASQLTLENRLAEAQVAAERARQFAAEAQLLDDVAQTDRLLAYLSFRLGDRTLALERIRQARATFAGLTIFARSDQLADCLALEAAFLLELQRPAEVLALLAGQPARPVLEYARARAASMLNRPEEALAALDRCAPQVDGTYAVATRALRASILRHQGRNDEALRALAEAYELARAQKSLKIRQLALQWHEWSADTAPVEAAAHLVEGVLAELPAAFAERVRQRPATRELLTLAGRAPPLPPPPAGWLSRADFLRQVGMVLKKHPSLATSVPLLPTSLAQKAESLRDEVLIEYYLGERELVIMLAGREGFVLRTLAVERTAIEERVARVRRQLLGGASADAAAASELARVLLEPVADRLAGRSVVLLAHGPLLGLPWDLLPGPPLDWSLWAGEALSRYSAANPQVLAVGNVTGVDLPGSAREVEAVGRLLAGQVLSGPAATAAALRAAAPQADVVHLATHSQPSHLQLSDGKLLLDEIYALPLRPGALVVLSSCEGAAAEGQERGPVTLASAFLAAGASQVVASLTPVVDEEAEALFAEFYGNLARGLTPGAALRDAKQARRKTAGRADWAAFVLLGGL